MSIDKEIKGMVQLLARMADDYDRFQELVLDQRAALVENNVTKLGSILPQMENITEQIFAKNDNRIAFMTLISQKYGSELQKIAEIQAAFPDEDYTELMKVSERVQNTRNEVAHQVEVNAALLHSATHKNQMLMEAVLRVPARFKAGVTPTYNAKGSTAVRKNEAINLFNRRG